MYKLDMRRMKEIEVYDLNQPLSPFVADGTRAGLIDSFNEYRERIWATGSVWIKKGEGWVRTYDESTRKSVLKKIKGEIKRLKTEFA